ncbi:helix-turn-helix domain-containing protein [Actinocorallia longicatena]|uniref:Helix-turn-helix domain-containing protein n=1 Tax=Actinocorallia longicatena TaxID=111803 RepID=A0ABP6QKF5_9ACTN
MTDTLIRSRALTSLESTAPEIADAAVDQAALTWTVPPGLRHALREAISGLLDPAPHGGAWALALFQRMGARSANDGIPLSDVHRCQQAATGTAVELLIRRLLEAGAPADPHAVGRLMQRVLDVAADLKEATTTGYLAASNAEPPAHHRKLLELLLRPGVDPARLRRTADQARWPLPRGLAAVALCTSPGSATLRVPPDVLAHPSRHFLILPDPDGPGRRELFGKMLDGRPAAIGPTVGPLQAPVSLRIARQTLDLAGSGAVTVDLPVRSMDHVPDLAIMGDPELTRRLAERRLAPIADQPRRKRAVLLHTLLASFECCFATPVVADRLHVHTQTVRYRVRQLEAIFGPSLHDPDQALDYMLALRAWVLMSSPAGTGLWQS